MRRVCQYRAAHLKVTPITLRGGCLVGPLLQIESVNTFSKKTNSMRLFECYISSLLIIILFMADVASANSKRKFDGTGVICPAENAIASHAEKAHGWSPRTLIFWFDQGSVVKVKDHQNKHNSDLIAHSQSANYYSNDEELWFDLGYTFSLNLQTLQLYWVISMGGDTTLRNKKCQFLAGDTFWNALNSDKP